MSISIGTDGRVVTGKKNVVVPPECAGVGDIVFLDSNRNMYIIACGTYNSSTIASAIGSGYAIYGVIFGFINGMARVMSKSPYSRKFTEGVSFTTSSSVAPICAQDIAGSVVPAGGLSMRNGVKTPYYTAMDVDKLMASTTPASTSPALHPSACYGTGTIYSKAAFDALVAGNGNAKDVYTTYRNYMCQTIAVRGSGSPFMAHDSNHKFFEQGKWNTYLLGRYTTSDPDTNISAYGSQTADISSGAYYPAAQSCFNHYEAGCGEVATDHNWWLPTMDELFDIVSNGTKITESGALTVSSILSTHLHSCIMGNQANTSLWFAHSFGMSSFERRGVYTAMRAWPVTLIKLTPP